MPWVATSSLVPVELREAQAALNLPGTIYTPDVQDQLGLAYGRHVLIRW